MGPFFWEAGEGGKVTRLVELVGDDRCPRIAAALDEVVRERDSGGVEAVTEYEARYGVLMEKPIVAWSYPHEDMAQASKLPRSRLHPVSLFHPRDLTGP
jgi:hypothetical protein